MTDDKAQAKQFVVKAILLVRAIPGWENATEQAICAEILRRLKAQGLPAPAVSRRELFP
jgi:hypothetical protein